MFIQKIKSFLVLSFLFLTITPSFSTHIAGWDMNVECLGGGDFRFHFRAYRDCAGVNSVTSAINIEDPLGSCGQQPIALGPWSSYMITEVSPICPSVVTYCTEPSMLAGVEEYYLTRDYQLDTTCLFRVSWSDCCRNEAITSGAAEEGIYNSFAFIGANSCNNNPEFTNPPIFYACQGRTSQFSQGAYDTEGDSLSYSLFPCKQDEFSDVTYNPGFSPTTPLGPTWQVSINPLNGDISLVPSPGLMETGVLCITVNEYRNGVHIGNIRRDMQISIVNCGNNIPPSTSGLTSITPNASVFQSLVMVPQRDSFCFSVPMVDPDTGASGLVTLSWDENLSGGIFFNALNPLEQTSFTGINPVGTFCFNPPGDGVYEFLLMAEDGHCPLTGRYQTMIQIYVGDFASVSGNIYEDLNGDCIYDMGEEDHIPRIIEVLPGPQYFMSDQNGDYMIPLEIGNYTLGVNLNYSSWIQQSCPSAPFTQAVSITSLSDTISGVDFGYFPIPGCPMLEVDLSSAPLVRCDTSFYVVHYCNIGPGIATNAYVQLSLDAFTTFISSPIPHLDLGNGQFEFQVGNISPGQCGQFNVNVAVACSLSNGMTSCAEAHIYPDSSCFPSPMDSVWDKSSVSVTGNCDGDSLVCFTILNTGDPVDGDMDGVTEYRIYEDNILVHVGNIQLVGGQDTLLCWPANGSTIRLECDQRPHHPGNSHPQESIEFCGTPGGGGSPSLGQIGQMPLDENSLQHSVSCNPILTAYDPNNKLTSPVGVGPEHLIAAETRIEYQINFQNLGQAPAEDIRIMDSLSSWVDVNSIRLLGSSHDLTDFHLSGPGYLQFVFEDIYLTYKDLDEMGSMGFVRFSILPKEGIPLGTVIENTASIYFDFNDAVVTNTAFNTIGEFPIIGENTLQGIQVLDNSTCVNHLSDLIELSALSDTPDQVQLSVSSGNPNLVSPSGLMLAGTSPDWGLVINPNHDSSGVAEISCLFSDASGNTSTMTFSYVVNPSPILSVVNFEATMLSTPTGVIEVTGAGTGPFEYGIGSPLILSWGPDPLFTQLGEGEYVIGIRDANGCVSTVDVGMFSASTESGLSDNRVKLFPNPSNGIFFLEPAKNITGLVTIGIYNSHGQLVKEIRNEEGIGSRLEMDLSSLPSSIYYIELKSEGYNWAERLVKR